MEFLRQARPSPSYSGEGPTPIDPGRPMPMYDREYGGRRGLASLTSPDGYQTGGPGQSIAVGEPSHMAPISQPQLGGNWLQTGGYGGPMPGTPEFMAARQQGQHPLMDWFHSQRQNWQGGQHMGQTGQLPQPRPMNPNVWDNSQAPSWLNWPQR